MNGVGTFIHVARQKIRTKNTMKTQIYNLVATKSVNNIVLKYTFPIKIQLYPKDLPYTVCVPLVKHKCLKLPEHLSLYPVFLMRFMLCNLNFLSSLLQIIVFFVPFLLDIKHQSIFQSLHLFDLRYMVAPLVSSNLSVMGEA